jgi:hypothetical protein
MDFAMLWFQLNRRLVGISVSAFHAAPQTGDEPHCASRHYSSKLGLVDSVDLIVALFP